MKNTSASVSVVIPCYCCSGSIMRAVKSVINQSLLPKELFLIDDASQDNNETQNALHSLQEKYGGILPIQVITLNKNQGPGEARNTGMSAATQKYIAFLDADDSWHPDKLQIQYHWMENNPDYCITGHLCNVSRDTQDHEDIDKSFTVSHISKLRLMVSNPFSTPSVMLRRENQFKFEPGQFYAEDYFLWQKYICSGLSIARIELNLAYLHKARYGEAGLSNHLWSMEKAELKNYWKLRDQKLIGNLATVLYSTYSILRYFRRIFLSLVNQFLNRKS